VEMGVEEIDGMECEVYYDPNDMAYEFWFGKNGKYFRVFPMRSMWMWRETL